MRLIRKLASNVRGASAIEYALIASLISVAAIAAYHGLGNKVSGGYQNVDNTLSRTI